MTWLISITTIIMVTFWAIWMIGIHQILSDIRDHLSQINRRIK